MKPKKFILLGNNGLEYDDYRSIMLEFDTEEEIEKYINDNIESFEFDRAFEIRRELKITPIEIIKKIKIEEL